jgi:hypothetical protein
MRAGAQAGQAMVEMAIGVTIFLAASLGAVQLGISALSAEGAQSAALVGARVASGAPIRGTPLAQLAAGQAAAEASLSAAVANLAQVGRCGGAEGGGQECGLPQTCVEYRGNVPQMGTLQPCPTASVGSTRQTSLGPVPTDLDGSQNPNCHGSDCFGVARSMSPCAQVLPRGQLAVCLAYTSWPAAAVDIWIRGTLRTVIPVASAAGLDALPVSVQLRLQVEALTT